MGSRWGSVGYRTPTCLGGVMVIKGKFADGSPMMASPMIAIPNYARMNRNPSAPETPPPATPPAPGMRPPSSIVWISEA
jgi:hypothetical protein